MLIMLAGPEMPTSGIITYNGEPITGPASDRSLIFKHPRSILGCRRSITWRSV
jgi:ABC-type taurine transport system ATPase subunit